MHSLFRLWQYVPMLLILCVSSAAYVGVQNYLEQNPTKKVYMQRHEPLYIMKNPVFNYLDIPVKNNNDININIMESKIKSYQIKASQALQYEDNKNYTLNSVRIDSKQNSHMVNAIESSTLNIVATTANMNAEFDTLNLSDANILHQHSSGKKMDIEAKNMLFHPKLDQVYTKNATHIRQTLSNGKTHMLEADTMYFDNITYNLDLKGHAKGIIQ